MIGFALSAEQQQFADAVHTMLTDADAMSAARSWSDGDTAPGRALWRRLGDLGVTALPIPEKAGGLGAQPIDWVLACEELGHHAMPGPVAETVAAVPVLLQEHDLAAGLADGTVLASLAAPPLVPYAVDADLILHVASGEVRRGRPGSALSSVDRTRQLFPVTPGEVLFTDTGAAARACDAGALACAAQLLGAGRALLETTVAYAKQRVQFGRPIGQFQAVKHQLADVLIGLEFARPLLWRAALAFGDDEPTAARDVSAAKVACAAAADRAARTALQVHGAIGYTLECDVGIWLLRVRALIPAWGDPSWHRARVAASLGAASLGAGV